MDESEVDLEQEVAQLRAALAYPDQPPLGLASRLEAAVHSKINGDEVGWEPRLVVACVVFAVGAAMIDLITGTAIILAVAAAAYSRFAIGAR